MIFKGSQHIACLLTPVLGISCCLSRTFIIIFCIGKQCEKSNLLQEVLALQGFSSSMFQISMLIVSLKLGNEELPALSFLSFFLNSNAEQKMSAKSLNALLFHASVRALSVDVLNAEVEIWNQD